MQGGRPNGPAYYRAVAQSAPRKPLLEALDRIDSEPIPPGTTAATRLAVDLGCGGGTDTVELLRRGWRVIAIDVEPQALEVLLARPDLVGADGLQTIRGELKATTWPSVDLVNASLSLPFLAPDAFEVVWQRIIHTLAP